jgi:hypothetical protein
LDTAEVARHEATHAVVALRLGKELEFCRIERQPIPGRSDVHEVGETQVERDRVPDRDDLIIFLSAGMFEGSGIAADVGAGDHGIWPPLWPILPGEGDRRQVRALVRLLDLDEDDYRATIAETRAMLDDPELKRWIARVATALVRKGHLSGEEVEALRPAPLVVSR